jgi:translation initiation factor 2 subunit 3
VKYLIAQSEVNIGIIGHVDHGKTALTKMLTGKWVDTHSEELKRGISIRLGYADVIFKKLPKIDTFEAYTTLDELDGKKTEAVKRISIVDSPGHESLMATMLSGVAIIDCAILVIAANEKCPMPRTMEHLLAAKYSGIKDLIVVQNKIDLVTEEQAKQNYIDIKKFLEELDFKNVPIIPISANHSINKDVLIYAISNYFKKNTKKESEEFKMYIVRSFDVNKPGANVDNLIGGIIGGSIVSGKIKLNDEIEINIGEKNIKTKALALNTELGAIKEAGPGGLIAIATNLDPSVTQNDKLKGQVVFKAGKMPLPKNNILVDMHTIDRLLVDDLKKPLVINEPLIITVGTTTAVGQVTSIKNNLVRFSLRVPVIIDKEQQISISRRSVNGWRLYGYGFIKE